MWQYVAQGGMQVVGDLFNRSAEARQVNGQIKADTITATQKSKASGTETLLTSQRAAERIEQTGRQALQLKGAAQASADSSGIGGNSVSARVSDIEFQAEQAIAIARSDAESKRKINDMANRASYEARLFTAKNYKPKSLGKILAGAGLGVVTGMAMDKFGGSLFGGEE
jgi:hypothetical protein